jgi:hypothetical protein
MSDRRQTWIDPDALGARRNRIPQAEDSQGSSSVGKRTSSKDFLGDFDNARRQGVVYSTTSQKRPSLARPSAFPINANELAKAGDPWQEFEKSYNLRLGTNYRVTVAERKASPYNIVAIRSFSSAMEDSQIQLLRGIQHENFARTLHVFRSAELTYIAFEHAPVSLHEISRSRVSIAKLELAAILGQVSSHSILFFGQSTNKVSLTMGLHIYASRV